MKALARAGVGLLLLLLALAAPASALGPEYTAQDPPDVVFTDAITAKASELGNDPVRIYEFVRNELRFELYHGLMKGPEATLLSGGGNEYDLAALLSSLLRTAGVPTRFVRGRVRIHSTDARAWTGAETAGDAATLFKTVQPQDWIGSTEATASGGYLELNHIWIEAYVGLGSYRGAGAGSPTGRGPAWVPLDPSFKRHEWTPATSSIAGNLNYLDEDGYLLGVQPKLPLESFEDQVRGLLAGAYQGGQPSSLDGAMLTARILKEAPGVLPNALPYELPPGSFQVRAAGLVALHFGEFDTASGFPSYRYERRVHLCKKDTADCHELPETDPDKVLLAKGWSAAWQGKRVTIWFPPTAESAPKLREIGYASCSGVNGATIFTVPTVSAGGTEQAAAATTTELCKPLEVVVETRPPHGVWGAATPNPTLVPGEYDIKAGEVYLASFDEWGASAAQVADAAGTLVAWSNAIPLAQDPSAQDLAFIDLDEDGVKDAGESYLPRVPDAQEILTGSLLHLANVWYFDELRRSHRRVAGLFHRLVIHKPAVGRVTSGREVEYLFDVPFGLAASNLLIDLNVPMNLYTRDALNLNAQNAELILLSYQASALEHAVWEEIAAGAAVSTVKGFQLGAELDSEANPVIPIGPDPSKTPAQLAQDAATVINDHCNATACNQNGGLDLNTFCTIRHSFPTISAGPPGWFSECGTNPMTDVTRGLWILSKSHIDYNGWRGYVFARWTATSLAMSVRPTGGWSGNAGYMTDWVADWGSPDPYEIYDLDLDSWTFESAVSKLVTAADPVSVTHGSYFETHTDLEIPGRGGLGFRLLRSYNSRLDFAGSMGYGWIHTFEQHLREEVAEGDEPAKVVWVTEEAVEEPWDDEATGLVPQAWNHHELVRQPDGSYTITTKAGMVYRFLPTNAAGIAKLSKITDRNGNSLTCVYGGPLFKLLKVRDDANRELTFTYDFPAVDHLNYVEDWTGRSWDYAVDANGDLTSYVDPEGHPWTYTYYSGLSNEALNHNVRRVERPAVRAGNAKYSMEFVYYPNDAVYKHTDAFDRVTRFSYNFFRMRTDVFHPDGGTEAYFYDEYANVTRHESAEGHVTEYEFDPPEKRDRTAEIDGLGFLTQMAYDGAGNMTSRTDRLGSEATGSYNEWGQPLSWEDRRGHTQAWVYDDAGNLKDEVAVLDGVVRFPRSHGYDSYGNRTSTTERFGDGRLATTTFEYDAAGTYVVRIEDPLGHETFITPDPLGRPERVETQRTVGEDDEATLESIVVTRTYDALGRTVREVDPVGTIRELDYDANGLLEESRTVIPKPGEPGPEVRRDVKNTYDVMDRLVASENALEEVTLFTYDERDRLTHVTSPLGHVTQTVPDLDGREIRRIDASGAVTETEYDPLGRPVRVVDALGGISETTYDPEGRVLERKERGERIVFQDPVYDDEGNLEEWEDANEIRTHQTFDELGRRETLEVGFGTSEAALTQYEYDLQGRLLVKTDPRGGVAKVAYDLLGRVEATSVVIGGTDQPRRALAYDEVGNLVRSQDGTGKVVKRDFDALGNVLEERDYNTPSAPFPARTAKRRYDALGRLAWSRGPDGEEETTRYDALDRVVVHTTPLGGTERFVYDADGRLAQHVQPSGATGETDPVILNYRYDARGVLTALEDPEAGTFSFEADPLGRPVRRVGPKGAEWRASYTTKGFVERIDIAAGASTEAIVYSGYDDRGQPGQIVTGEGTTLLAYTTLGRLQRADYPDASFEEFTYDAAGNRATRTDSATGSRTYHYNEANELFQILSGPTVVETFTRDSAGRRTGHMKAGVTTGFGYDGHGRLLTVTKPGYSATLVYGATGARTKRTETGAQVARYPSPRREVRGGQVFRVLRAGGTGAVVAEVEGPAGAVRSHALLRDGSMNVGHVVKTEGTTSSLEATPRRWKAFGGLRSGSSLLERGYASQAREGATGLVLMGARHYDPETGGFLQPDPLGIDVSELYAYAGSNPYLYWDPSGLFIQSHAAEAWSGVSGFLGPSIAGPLRDIGTGVAMTATSIFVPGAGEFMDGYTLQDPNAAGWEKAIAAPSLAVGVLTAGASPNTSGVIRGTRQAAGGVADLTTAVYHAVEGNLTRYIGITDDLARRAAEHLRGKGISIDAIPGLGNLTRTDARAVEQALIEKHGLARSGGTLTNKINSIAEGNPIYEDSLHRAQDLLKQAGVPGF